jgi:hypothetical protein
MEGIDMNWNGLLGFLKQVFFENLAIEGIRDPLSIKRIKNPSPTILA